MIINMICAVAIMTTLKTSYGDNKIMAGFQTENISILTRDGDRVQITPDEVALLNRVVMSEAGGESVYAQEAVATVILNRWQNPDNYAETIRGVIFETGQFSTHDNGAPTVSVRVAVHNAITYYNTEFMCLPYQVYYFRSGHYHDFGTPYCEISHLYFSLPDDVIL